jgi:putative drug exporter of the RND superfamily
VSRLLHRLGLSASRHPWRVLTAWLLTAAAAFLLNGSLGGPSDDTFRLPGAESQRAADLLDDRFPAQGVYTGQVVFHADAGLRAPAARAAVTGAVRSLRQAAHVVDATDPYDPRSAGVSADGRTAYTTVSLDTDTLGAADYAAAAAATAPARAGGLQVEYSGLLGAAKDDDDGGGHGEMLGIAVAVVVLAVAFGSLVAMTLPLAVALLALLIGTSAIGVLSGYFAVPNITTVVATMLGLGVGIDYALFVLARHRDELRLGGDVQLAAARANATAGLSVVFAGTTVIVAIAGLQIAGIPMLTTMGWGAALVVAVTMTAAVTLLPALLGLAGRHVNSGRLPLRGHRRAGGLSTAWARQVTAHPLRYGGAAALLLALLAVPVAALRIGFSDDGNLPRTSTLRASYDLLADGFGPGVNGPVQVVVDLERSTDRSVVDDVAAAVAAAPGVAGVTSPAVDRTGSLAVVVATPTTAPQDAATTELVSRLREQVLPAAVAGHDAEVMVTGSTPLQADVSERLSSRLPWFIAAVVGLSFLVLAGLFRSVLVPLKAAVLNVLSIAASYGVLVAIFQWGWGARLLGIEETVPINPLAPMLMFAILFGLSMDYEVFLLSRVREQYLRHGRPRRAVVEAMGSTARVITSAALIMVSVFAAFVLSGDVTTKLFGVGLAVAVLLDVTLVRLVLVPAAMSLLGHLAWWTPGRRTGRPRPDQPRTARVDGPVPEEDHHLVATSR